MRHSSLTLPTPSDLVRLTPIHRPRAARAAHPTPTTQPGHAPDGLTAPTRQHVSTSSPAMARPAHSLRPQGDGPAVEHPVDCGRLRVAPRGHEIEVIAGSENFNCPRSPSNPVLISLRNCCKSCLRVVPSCPSHSSRVRRSICGHHWAGLTATELRA